MIHTPIILLFQQFTSYTQFNLIYFPIPHQTLKITIVYSNLYYLIYSSQSQNLINYQLMQEEIEDPELITIQKQEYQSMKLQIQYLQSQLRIYQENSLGNLKIMRNQSSVNNKITLPFCQQCENKKANIESGVKSILPSQIKQEWAQWSKNLKIRSSKQSQEKNLQTVVKQDVKQNLQKQENKGKMSFIEGICIFGPKLQVMKQSPLKSFSVPHQLYSSAKYKKYEFHGGYLYPQDVSVKLVREQKVPLQVNRIIFKKNCKRQDTSVQIFSGQNSKNFGIYDQKLFNQCNPQKKIYMFSLHFSDFILLDSDELSDSPSNTNNNSVWDNLGSLKNIDQVQDELNCRSYFQSNQIIKSQNSCKTFLAKFTISIFTYFPLVNLLQKILLLTMDEIKIKRIQSYSKSNNPKNLDIRYFVKEFEIIVSKMMIQIEEIPPMMGKSGKFKIGDQIIEVNFISSWIQDQMFNGWAGQILKFINKDLLYQIFCHIILEESICIVCEDLYFLTYFTLLFVDLIIRPLSYPHPLVSIAFKEQLLGSPFTIVLGINKTTKWLDDNLDLISDNKITIDLNQEITIKSKKKIKILKSQKLRKIFSNFYKKLQPNSPNIFTNKKREPFISKSSTTQQDTLIKQLMGAIKVFFDQQFISHLPNNQIISHMLLQKSQKNNTQMINSIISAIEKYFFQSRKQKDKDFLIDAFAHQQIFYAYVCQRYKIK